MMMDYELNEFGLDEPLLDDGPQQHYSAFMLDQPLDLFDDFSESQESSLGSSGQTLLNDSPQDSLSSSSFSHNFHHNLNPGSFRRDSSDESDVGIVDDIVIPPILIGTKRTADGGYAVTNNSSGSSNVGGAGSTNNNNNNNNLLIVNSGVQGIALPPNAFIQTTTTTTNSNLSLNGPQSAAALRQHAARRMSTLVKMEPVAPPTPVATMTFVDDKKPTITTTTSATGMTTTTTTTSKPCLVISANGSLTAVPITACFSTGKVVNVKDLASNNATGAQVSASNAALHQQHQHHNQHQHQNHPHQQEELDRAAKRQLRILKNREAATLSRLRQKQYLESLEERVRLLARENEQVKRENEEMRMLVGRLHEENVGLRNNNNATSSGGSSPCHSISESSKSSVDDSAALSPVIASSPTFIIATAPAASATKVQQQQQSPVIDLDDEPVPKKILIKPVQTSSRVSVPIVTLPASAKPVIPSATISRDGRGISVVPKSELSNSQTTTTATATSVRRQSVTVGPSVFTLTRQPRTVVLIFSLIFAFNAVPFASRMFRESSTTLSPVSSLSSGGLGEVSLNGIVGDMAMEPAALSSNSRMLDGGRMLYPAGPIHSYAMKKRSAELSSSESSNNDLMVLPRPQATSRDAYYSYDLDDNDLPLMDDALLDNSSDDSSADRLPKCPTATAVNASHSQRIVNALSQWASLQQQQPLTRQNQRRVKPWSPDMPPRVGSLYDDGDGIVASKAPTAADHRSSSDLQLYRRRQQSRNMARASSFQNVESSESYDGSSLARYEKFAKTIRQRNDTFYMVSFHVDQLIFPALVVNRTSRPKMSLILPALFSLNETVAPPEGSVALMQIECEITDMKILHLGKHLIPLDMVLKHMREDGAQASGTSRMYRQWLYGKAAAAAGAA